MTSPQKNRLILHQGPRKSASGFFSNPQMYWMIASFDDPPPTSDGTRSSVAYIPVLRCIVLACVFALVAAPPRAAAQDVRVGARAGPTFGFLNDNAVPFTDRTVETNANPRIGSHAGMHVIVPVTDHFALQPELLYVQKGGHFSRPQSESYAVERYRLSYVQGELLGRRDISVSGPLSLHAVAGVSIDLALGGVLRRNIRTTEINLTERVALMETGQLQRWGVGALVGVGLGYPVGIASRLALELRYNPGFCAVFSGSVHSASTLPDRVEDVFPLTSSPLRHDVITVSLSYTLPPVSPF